MEGFLASSELPLAFVPVFASVLALPGPNAAFAVGQSLKYGVVRSLYVPLGFMLAVSLGDNETKVYKESNNGEWKTVSEINEEGK
ncbi:MAG: hypothetical protein ACPH5V_10965 [Alcanivorax sp.]